MPSPPNEITTSDPKQTRLSRLPDDCVEQLQDLEKAKRRRQLRPVTPVEQTIIVDGRGLLNLSSNDYLGLSQHPKLIQAAVEATLRHGVGSGASRLVSGTQPIHQQIEQRLAHFKHAEAALLLPTGYTANLAVLTTLAGPGDLIVMDKLVHASLIDAAKASRAEVRTFPHLNLNRAKQLLQRHRHGRRLLVTDSVFSMDGDCADLRALCDLADQCDASLIVDEAHGTGILGDDGSGLASAQGVARRIYSCGSGGIVISTASKALGSLGGIITADQPVIDLLINKARPLIYSTAVPPAQAAVIDAALDILADEPCRRSQLASISKSLRLSLAELGWRIDPHAIPTPVIPLIVGNEEAALSLHKRLMTAGIYAPAIRPPTVSPGQCRVRLSLRCDLPTSAVSQIIETLATFRA